jgi:hypothetical protein
MTFYNPFTNGKADARSRIFFPAVQTLKNHENSVAILPLDPDAVVGHGKPPAIIDADRADMDGRGFFAPEFNGIAD